MTEINFYQDLKPDFLKINNDPIVGFLNYRIYNTLPENKKKKIDCDRGPSAKSIYEQCNWASGSNLDFVDPDIINSYWTILRGSIEFSFCKYFSMEDSEYTEDEKALKYQFLLLFGGIGQKSCPACWHKERDKRSRGYSFGKLKEYLDGNPQLYGFDKLGDYSTEFRNRNSVGEYKLDAERYQWVIDNLNNIKTIIDEVTESEHFFCELKEMAKLTHTPGNLMILPKGLNRGKMQSAGDYFDLTLMSMKIILGSELFAGFVERYCLEDYIKDGEPIAFWSGHSFNNVRLTSKKNFTEDENKLLEKKTIYDVYLDRSYSFLVTVNNMIKQRGKRLENKYGEKLGIREE